MAVRKLRRHVGFIEPCIPVLVRAPPTCREWLHDIKHDGYRVIARKAGDQVNLWTRGAANCQPEDYADRMVTIAAAMRALPVDSCLLDGEAVVFLPDGRSDFHALRSRDGQAAATLFAVDALSIAGADLRQLPVEERRSALGRLLRRPPTGILVSELIDAPGEAVLRRACSLGLEGIVSKRRGSAYHSGCSEDWRMTPCSGYRRP